MAASKPPSLPALVVGANHRSATLGLRDRLFVEDAQAPQFLERLREAGLKPAMILSTCDRVEVQALHEDPDAAAERIIEIMAGHGGVDMAELKD